MSIFSAIGRHASSQPAHMALLDTEGGISYGELPAAITAAAEMLDAILPPDDGAVGLALKNGIPWVIADLALMFLGRPCVPLPPFFSPDQVQAALANAGATAVLNHDEGKDFVLAGYPLRLAPYEHAPALLPNGTAKISYTSGSTGSPKGICLSRAHLETVATSVVWTVGGHHAGIHLPVLPLGILLENVAGLYAVLIAGGTYRAVPLSDIGLGDPMRPQFRTLVQAIATSKATSLIMVPELLAGLTAALGATGLRLPQLNLVAVGGAATPPTLLARARILGLPIRQGYGLTECGSVIAVEDGSENERGSVGRPLAGVKIEFAADGEILVGGASHLGRVGHPAPDGLLATGDLGRLDASGRLWVTGRKSNLIVTNFGRNISPEWPESLLTGQPEIAQALVYGSGRPSPMALIVPRTPGADVALAIERVNDQLPVHARIASWRTCNPFQVGDGTLTANGRLRRYAIAERECVRLEGGMSFFDRLESETATERESLLRVPQLQAGLAGRISRGTYIDYLTQAYHHVRHTVPLMEMALSRLQGHPFLAAALEDYIGEETGHEAWILDDINNAGGDADEAEAALPSVATRRMVDQAYRIVCDGNPIALFGMVFVLEGTSIAMAQKGADALQASLLLPETAFRYLTSHGALDLDHMRTFEALMNRIQNPGDQADIIEMAKQMFRLFADVFASIPYEEQNYAYA
jgi:long-subunit acyl-CoA synthetase (AMP-forming)